MKSQQQSLSDVINAAIRIWQNESYNTHDISIFEGLDQDPIVRLLISTLVHQTNILENAIDDFQSQIVAQYIASTLPFHLVQPVPSFSMMQTFKVESLANSDDCYIDQSDSFQLIPNKQPDDKLRYHFIPLVRTKIINAEIITIQPLETNKISILLKCNEPTSNLTHVAFCFPSLTDTHVSAIYSGNSQLPIITCNQYDQLPYIEIFNNSIRFNNNSLQYGVFARLQELLPRHSINYCIIDYYDTQRNPLYIEDGCISLQIEFPEHYKLPELNTNDILINCFPIINIDITSTTLSSLTPIRKIDLRHANFLTVGSLSNYDADDDIVAIRQVNTERFTQTELFSLFRLLANKFNSEYYLFKEVIDKKTELAIQQVIALIDNSNLNNKQNNTDNDTYLMLRHPVKDTIGVDYITTLGAKANGLHPDYCQIVPSSTLFDTKRTRMLLPTVGGQDEVTDSVRINKLAKYYALTNDQLISRSDILNFCKKEILLSFNYAHNAIVRTSIHNIILPDATPQIKIDILLSDDHGDFTLIESTLQRLIQSKTATVFPVKVSLSYHEA